jgi:hypothetical protein
MWLLDILLSRMAGYIVQLSMLENNPDPVVDKIGQWVELDWRNE